MASAQAGSARNNGEIGDGGAVTQQDSFDFAQERDDDLESETPSDDPDGWGSEFSGEPPQTRGRAHARRSSADDSGHCPRCSVFPHT